MTNEELYERRNRAIPRGVASAFPIFASRATDCEIWDVEGRRYIDFAGGIAVLNVGHRHPAVIEAVRRQLDAFTHTAFQVMPYECYVALAEALNALAPFRGPAKTILLTTGAEAVENCIKIARVATGRRAVVAFTGGFHGRTMAALALTGKIAPYKTGFAPLPGEIYHVPFPSEANEISVVDSLRALEFLFQADVAPTDVAAILIEPVQGEGGFNPAPPALLVALRELCDRHGILLVADEVQSGFARTGRMFAIEHAKVEPDLVAIAKSLAGGLPLSGVIGRANVMDAVGPGGLGGTYGGNPLACAAALAVLDVIKKQRLCQRSTIIGRRIKKRLDGVSGRNDIVPLTGLRGIGAMIGIDVVTVDGKPDAATTKRILADAASQGLIVLSCGAFSNTIRILVPLTISDAMLDEGLDILERTLVSVRAETAQ